MRRRTLILIGMCLVAGSAGVAAWAQEKQPGQNPEAAKPDPAKPQETAPPKIDAKSAESAEPQQLYDLQHKLDASQVYFQSEVEAFAKVFYKPRTKQAGQGQAELYRLLAPAVQGKRWLRIPGREKIVFPL